MASTFQSLSPSLSFSQDVWDQGHAAHWAQFEGAGDGLGSLVCWRSGRRDSDWLGRSLPDQVPSNVRTVQVLLHVCWMCVNHYTVTIHPGRFIALNHCCSIALCPLIPIQVHLRMVSALVKIYTVTRDCSSNVCYGYPPPPPPWKHAKIKKENYLSKFLFTVVSCLSTSVTISLLLFPLPCMYSLFHCLLSLFLSLSLSLSLSFSPSFNSLVTAPTCGVTTSARSRFSIRFANVADCPLQSTWTLAVARWPDRLTSWPPMVSRVFFCLSECV